MKPRRIILGGRCIGIGRWCGGSMAIVVGVDYGTLSVRVSVVDSERGRVGSGGADYPLNRRREDPDYATQSHADHMRALVQAMGKASASAKVAGGGGGGRGAAT